VVVTGASAGVGRATARAFARRGYAVGLLARGSEGLDAAAKEIESAGGRARNVPADVCDPSAVEAAATEIEKSLGPIDVWVNNAMTSVFASLKQVDADEFRRVTEVTYLGVVHGTMAALSRMLERDSGVIVQVGSALAYRGIPLQSAYCGSKHAIKGFTESVRTELLHDNSNVRMTIVHLPALNTPQFGWVLSRLPRKAQPVPPIFQPEVAADAIVWAAEHGKRELHVGGSTVATIAAGKLFPALLDRYLAKTAYDSQQTEAAEDPDRPSNLWEPVPGDHGARGAFDRQAHTSSMQLYLAQHRGWVGAGAGALLLAWLAKRSRV
jgi:short-subunit dehydrogenase